jgi:hypothetical protein
LLADALARNASRNSEPLVLVWTTAPMHAKVNLADKDAVARAMENS